MRAGILILALLLSGCTTVDRAQLFDGATTWYAFSQGFSEANPVLSGLSGPEIIVAKFAITQAVKLTPEVFCVPATQSLTVTGVGAGIWNLAVIASSWWAAIPVIAIVVWTYWDSWWLDSWLTCQLPQSPFDLFENEETNLVEHSFGDK